MNITQKISKAVKEALQKAYDVSVESFEFQATRKDFEGDLTLVVFPLLKYIKGNPVAIGTQIGEYLKEHVTEVKDFNVIKGFLNLVLSDAYLLDSFYEIKDTTQYGFAPKDSAEELMVEYSSPNTNKPLHLGHIRNNLLGYSVAEILKAAGHKVHKTQIINDRGIHICKSMLAYQKFGKGETPESTGLKGDKLIGNYYVKFDQVYREEISKLVTAGIAEEEAKKRAASIVEAQDMLKKWEEVDKDVRALWEKMNNWVYKGFDTTYQELGVDFDVNYYESDTYLLGKEIIMDGLAKGIFFQKEDGSVWIDLSEEGLDEKILLRADGTAVYMTQDIGTAIQRVNDFPNVKGMVYTVGNEQDYHFKVLFLILKKLGYDWAENLYHLSYGMVDLPEGKMKSREGTVVDADDLMQEMTDTAREISKELGKLEGYSEEEKEELYKIIGLGALKYFILKVDPKKRILFDPRESIDFNGNTGPFIQYTYARIQSLLRRTTFDYTQKVQVALDEKERNIIKNLQTFPEVVLRAAAEHSPALIANYAYDLVKTYNTFYQSLPILSAEDESNKIFRIQLSHQVGEILQLAFGLLGINMPDRM